MLRIRAFRAIDDIESCKLFALGHARVLLDYGITKVTSSSTNWFYNPSVYVIIAEKLDTNESIGGIRIHIADNITPLPMVDAISAIDKKVYKLIENNIADGTGELCGLWNSKNTSGMGLGSYILMRAGISATAKLKLSTLFALCAPHTLRISLEKGFEIEKSIGNEGTFIYPKLDLVATSIVIRDTNNLPLALPIEKTLINELRKNVNIERLENGIKESFQILYNL